MKRNKKRTNPLYELLKETIDEVAEDREAIAFNAELDLTVEEKEFLKHNSGPAFVRKLVETEAKRRSKK